jgi:two-component system, OmpR family, response regulator
MTALKVLFVEDQLFIRDIAEKSLSFDPDIEVKTASSGVGALDVLAKGFKPDVVLLDVMMPEMDGPATLSSMRALPGFGDTPVIFVTARAQLHEQSRLIAMGAKAVITKPFDPMTFAQQVRHILA